MIVYAIVIGMAAGALVCLFGDAITSFDEEEW